jgi:two-component sensor histidine kinase
MLGRLSVTQSGHAAGGAQLCQSIRSAMIGDHLPTTLKVTADAGSVTSREAVSLGLIVTELILNALKHAFPDNGKSDCQIAVEFDVAGTIWKLSVGDNGSTFSKLSDAA